ncbi:hypothetical protein GCM10023321_73230 [Pseudonocardia eucalypti]|uniref:Uncharacterized protein n=1 Tax=Pseudonocardia eucalypti TaxID=648755 RepID=A0ABP9R8B6_9PSEU
MDPSLQHRDLVAVLAGPQVGHPLDELDDQVGEGLPEDLLPDEEILPGVQLIEDPCQRDDRRRRCGQVLFPGESDSDLFDGCGDRFPDPFGEPACRRREAERLGQQHQQLVAVELLGAVPGGPVHVAQIVPAERRERPVGLIVVVVPGALAAPVPAFMQHQLSLLFRRQLVVVLLDQDAHRNLAEPHDQPAEQVVRPPLTGPAQLLAREEPELTGDQVAGQFLRRGLAGPSRHVRPAQHALHPRRFPGVGEAAEHRGVGIRVAVALVHPPQPLEVLVLVAVVLRYREEAPVEVVGEHLQVPAGLGQQTAGLAPCRRTVVQGAPDLVEDLLDFGEHVPGAGFRIGQLAEQAGPVSAARVAFRDRGQHRRDDLRPVLALVPAGGVQRERRERQRARVQERPVAVLGQRPAQRVEEDPGESRVQRGPTDRRGAGEPP